MVGMCFTVRPVFTFGRVVVSYSQMGVEVSYLIRQADMGGGLYQISLQVLHWESISFSAEFFKASMPLHAACFFFMCQKFAQGKTFFKLLIGHEYFSHRLQMSCCEKKNNPFYFLDWGQFFWTFALWRSDWLNRNDCAFWMPSSTLTTCHLFVMHLCEKAFTPVDLKKCRNKQRISLVYLLRFQN